MSLFNRIQQTFRKQQPTQTQTTAKPAAEEAASGQYSTEMMRRFAAEHERMTVLRACREMYKTDPRAKKMIQKLAEDMVKGGYSVTTQNERATASAMALYQRLNLGKRLDDWVRMAARDGDAFLEVEINDALEIVAVSRKPTLLMHRNSDRSDRFPTPERAYWLGEDMGFSGEAPKNAVWFAEWQIIHARWDHDEGSRYGTPLLESGIGSWKKVREGELDVAVRRKTRSGLRYLHVLEGADDVELKRYKAANEQALKTTSAVSDFFSNKPGSLSVIQGDAHLAEIADVEHHIATWFTTGDVPMELIGYGEDLNRDVLGPKMESYNETLEQRRQWVVSEILRPLFELQWLLDGFLPESLEAEITWKAKAAITAQEILSVADAAMRLRILGVPETIIWSVLARFIPGFDAATLAAQVQPGDSDAGRFANILAGFGGG